MNIQTVGTPCKVSFSEYDLRDALWVKPPNHEGKCKVYKPYKPSGSGWKLIEFTSRDNAYNGASSNGWESASEMFIDIWADFSYIIKSEDVSLTIPKELGVDVGRVTPHKEEFK